MSNIRKMYVVGFLQSLQFFGGVLVPMLTDWGGITFTQVMLLQSWFMVWNTILQVPTGMFADRVGRKKSIVLGFAVAACGFYIYSSYQLFAVFFLGEFLLALGVGLVAGADDALIYDTLVLEFPDEAERKTLSSTVFGRYQAVHMAGLLIASPLGSIIGQEIGLMMPMRLTVIPCLLGLLVALTLKEKHVVTNKPREFFKWRQLTHGLSEIRKNHNLLILSLDFAVVATFGRAIIWLYQPMLLRAGMPIAGLGTVHAIAVAVEILVMISVSRFDRLLHGRRKSLRVTLLLTVIGLIVALIAVSVTVGTIAIVLTVLATILVIGFGMARKPYLDEPINRQIESSERATVVSTVRMIYYVGSALLNPIIGFTADISLVFPVLGLLIVLSLWAIFWPVKEI